MRVLSLLLVLAFTASNVACADRIINRGYRRVRLLQNTTFFVATTGTDNTSCGTSSANACATAQQMYLNLQQFYDLNGHVATIQEGTGTYTTAQSFAGGVVGQFAGAGGVIIGGTGAGTAVHNVTAIGSTCLDAVFGASIEFENLEVEGCANGISASEGGAHAYIGPGIVFGAMPAGSAHIYLSRQSYIEDVSPSPYNIAGAATYHIVCSHQGNLRFNKSNTGTTIGIFSTGVAWGQAFLDSESGCDATFSLYTAPPYNLNGQTVTGFEWQCSSGGTIQTLVSEQTPNFFPGNVAPSFAAGSCFFNQGLHGNPTKSGFGTGPGLIGTDYSGYMVEGTSSTGGTITFTNPFPGRPNCRVTYEGTPPGSFTYSVSASAITISHASVNSPTFDYQCGGYGG